MFIKKNKNLEKRYFMQLALFQARKNLGNTKTNPSVGCVLVKKNTVIAAASTGYNGTPHAEINAIESCSKNTQKSDLYVTLEPCSHYGKTPPCVTTIKKKGVNNVFFSIKDPDLRSFNKSISYFKKANIYAECGIFSEEIKMFYRSYIKSKKENLPFVTAKLAVSKDFYTINKKKRWITNKFSRGRVHLMRANHDCIITSSKSISKDNSMLNCRIKGIENQSPARIILDKNLIIPVKSKIIKYNKNLVTIIFYNKENKKKEKFLKRNKIKLIRTPLDVFGNLDLKSTLFKIKKMGFSRVFLESGLTLTRSFLEKGLIDDFILFVSNKKLNSNGNADFRKTFDKFLKNTRRTNENVNLLGDKLISYKIK